MDYDYMPDESKKSTRKDESKMMLKEENLIVDLELAVKKEKFKKKKKTHRKFELQKKENLKNRIIPVFSWLC